MTADTSEGNLRTLRIDKVIELFPISRATIYRLIKSGAFPPPIQVGGTNVWLERDIAAWLEAKRSASRRKRTRSADGLI